MFAFSGVFFLGMVNSAYEKHQPSLRMRLYKTKAQFNNESYDIIDMFKKQRNFKVICFATDKKMRNEYDN